MTLSDLIELMHSNQSARLDRNTLMAIREAALRLVVGVGVSYHDNGFLKSTIWQSHDGSQSLRVHFWPADNGVGADTNVHGHGWSFSSIILAGEIAHEIYEPGGETRLSRFAYTASSQEELRYQGQTEIRLVESAIFRPGDRYAIKPSILHRVWTGSPNGAATLVLTVDRDPTRVVDVYRSSRPKQEIRELPDLSMALAALFKVDSSSSEASVTNQALAGFRS